MSHDLPSPDIVLVACRHLQPVRFAARAPEVFKKQIHSRSKSDRPRPGAPPLLAATHEPRTLPPAEATPWIQRLKQAPEFGLRRRQQDPLLCCGSPASLPPARHMLSSRCNVGLFK